jgi:hypothetical protein
MSQAPAHETLRRLFDVIVDEAQKDPALAEKLLQAMSGPLGAGAETREVRRRQPFNASGIHAVNILRLHGEPALRGKLEQIKAADALRSVAVASGLVLSGSASKARATRAELIDGIIAAAKHYDAQRSAASE